ncbi:uncharacterized protein N0V89_002568 [Didymosphaeria variabile]|uniref:Aromatic compound dioxygenase n=1 Tax=Didymosphaeria variabile TaxID=1932322 RepID=A0A9W8XSC3_9PLEO|nr:uncharacterized protein N0V89_002568 [Didymosphaeria variabile]KAJ4357991.1 hypothetical protein N0V89_002568 [Didymosphaeria variabile]
MKFSTILSAAMLAQQGMSHPGQSKAEALQELQQRREYRSMNKRTLADCADQLKARGNDALLQARRSAKLEAMRKKRSISTDKPLLKARSFDDVLNTDHHSNLTVTPETADPATLFTGNASCTLTPETTEGPYWVAGELVRENIVDGQAGVPLTLDIQVVDVNTCEVVPQAYTEIWHCNSTGVYGVVAGGNGNQADLANINNTALRGIQQTDNDGVVAFETLFPGHSEKEAPYNTNTQALTVNKDDFIFEEEAANVDPSVEYVYLGDSISEGLFGWIAFGIDTAAARNVTPAVYLTENGGVANPNAGAGGPGGPGGPPPTGSRPTNLPTATASA